MRIKVTDSIYKSTESQTSSRRNPDHVIEEGTRKRKADGETQALGLTTAD